MNSVTRKTQSAHLLSLQEANNCVWLLSNVIAVIPIKMKHKYEIYYEILHTANEQGCMYL